jgi:amidohydrolase
MDSMDSHTLQVNAWERITSHEQALRDLATRIWENPEVGYAEEKASAWLCEMLAANGFTVEKPFGGLPTAFLARMGAGQPSIALLAEYDALPGVGHGCGHNLIGTAAVGAAIGVAGILEQTGGSICVIGTPAEEFFDREEGKTKLLAAGGFKGIDAALMLHPFFENQLVGGDLGFVAFDLVFHGRPAHAAADPWNGANALDGLITTFVNINALRQQLRPETRIHGIITDGGQAPNIIPTRAAARFMVRSPERDKLEEIYQRVQECARAGALASGTTVEILHLTTVLNTRTNRTIDRLVTANFDEIGEPMVKEPHFSSGSTDFANVSHVMPAVSFNIKTHPAGIPWHSRLVTDAATSDLAMHGMLAGARVLAGTAIDLLGDPAQLAQARKDIADG